jgi:hypothetical protein
MREAYPALEATQRNACGFQQVAPFAIRNFRLNLSMTEKRPKQTSQPANQSVENELDALNAEVVRRKRKGPTLRRMMEATIESSARKRRSSEVPASKKIGR